jgi:hypothetical protein
MSYTATHILRTPKDVTTSDDTGYRIRYVDESYDGVASVQRLFNPNTILLCMYQNDYSLS